MPDATPTSDSPSPAPERWRWRRWIVLAVCLALIGWFAHFAYLRLTLRPTPRPEYWAAQLAALDPPPPGAITAAEAAKILANRPWETVTTAPSRDLPFQVLTGDWDESRPDISAITAIFEGDEFKAARAALQQAVEAGFQLEPWLLGYPFVFTSSNPYYGVRRWTVWMVAHSRWAFEHPGDSTSQFDDWRIALKLARQLRRSRTRYSLSLEYALQSMIASEMIVSAKDNARTIDPLAMAHEIDDALGPLLDTQQFLPGMRMEYQNLLESVYVGQGRDWISVSDLAHLVLSINRLGSGSPSPVWNLASPLFHNLRKARTNVDAHFESSARCKDIVSCNRVLRRQPEAPAVVELTILDGIGKLEWARSVSHPSPAVFALCAHYSARCYLEGAITTLAIEAFHHRNGTYPQGLKQLIPEYLSRLPIDYADLGPLRYRRTEYGYLLYSIGVDGKDDAGISGAGYSLSFDETNPDVVFSAVRR